MKRWNMNDRITALILLNPELTDDEVAERLNTTEHIVFLVRKEMEDDYIDD